MEYFVETSPPNAGQFVTGTKKPHNPRGLWGFIKLWNKTN